MDSNKLQELLALIVFEGLSDRELLIPSERLRLLLIETKRLLDQINLTETS